MEAVFAWLCKFVSLAATTSREAVEDGNADIGDEGITATLCACSGEHNLGLRTSTECPAAITTMCQRCSVRGDDLQTGMSRRQLEANKTICCACKPEDKPLDAETYTDTHVHAYSYPFPATRALPSTSTSTLHHVFDTSLPILADETCHQAKWFLARGLDL